MKAAIYTRISRDDDQVGLGVARQLSDCRTLAERKGWTLVEYTENDQSAASERNRKVWRTMLRDIADGRVQSVVAWANDRLYRNVQDQLDLLKAVKGQVA